MFHFEKVLPDTYLLRTPFGSIWSGVYLIIGKENILIDSGATAEIVDNALVPALAELGMTLNQINWLINTHSHGDHVGGNRRILELSCEIKIAAFALAVPKIENPLPYGAAIRLRFPEHSPAPQKVLDGCHVDCCLNDGELLAGRLRVIHTPGHDSECICLYDEKTGALFTGDSLQGFGMISTGGAGLAFYQYLDAYRDSLDKLKKMQIEHILAAHDYAPYGYSAHGKLAVRRYLDACAITPDIYETLVNNAVDAGIEDIASITERVIYQVGAQKPEKMFLSMYSIEQHMSELKQNKM